MTLVPKPEQTLDIQDIVIYCGIIIVVLTLMGLYTYLKKLVRRLFNIEEPEVRKLKD